MDFSIKFDTLPGGRPEIAAGFGVFDGVHPGHRLIISTVAAMAAENGALPAAVTFVPHPRAVIPGMEAPPLIISVDERRKRLREAGAAVTGIIPFSPGFGALAPECFLDALLCSGCPHLNSPASVSVKTGVSDAGAKVMRNCWNVSAAATVWDSKPSAV